MLQIFKVIKKPALLYNKFMIVLLLLMEYAKSRAMCVMCVSVVCVPRYQKCANFLLLRVNVPINVSKASQFFNLACQFFDFACQKTCQFFDYFSKENIFQVLNFSITLNICKFQEYLSKSRKFISRNKEFKFWRLQNFIKEMQN